ncbi:peroxisomal membrane protein PEX12 [Galdieria sulphuraria]|uniref:Peroxisome assembly protein 12 n=1 Tax=Galdieria sulphuraria TaxID=130081 RepID=M2XWD0_GALSU|nr:peroxisomal membrane protein PEX12 [Galdieria sulphuraria]EME27913.1 peroxisomal membrane protein PEX12 [Galdieria sulphuraria]|eukprot:XP_005704433.1 peroxisomal membrane protein PEX12 [Galdieria sulphuraria]
MFFTHFSQEDLRPSYFEMFAQERLLPTLKPALRFVLQVFAQRHSSLVPVAMKSDELFTLLHFLLELNSLRKNQASCAEAFYGLRRGHTFSAREASNIVEQGPLSRNEVISSLFCLVFVPYIKQKLDNIYEEASGSALADMFTGFRAVGSQQESVIKNLFVQIYPTFHALYQLWFFLQQLLFLLGKTKFYSPLLRLQGIVIRRLTSEELRATPSYDASNSSSKLVGFVDKLIHLLKITAIGGVFAFKFLEWLVSAENKLPKNAGFVPSPPVPLRPSSKGISLPADRTLCPLCHQPRRNPAVCVSSGYVFCYQCLFTFVERESQCPVTKMPSTIHDIQRLFHEQNM